MQGTGALVTAAAVGRVHRPDVLFAAGDDPIPVSGSPAFTPFSVWAPGVFDPIDADPISIENFNGVAGLAYINGFVTRTNTDTGEQKVFPFNDADMRFMKGVYRGVDGKPRQATFGFV
jgi:hypothetical protein